MFTTLHRQPLHHQSSKEEVLISICMKVYSYPYFVHFKCSGDRIKFPATPPARKKNQVVGGATAPLADFPLTKSTSHESQLANRVGDVNESSG